MIDIVILILAILSWFAVGYAGLQLYSYKLFKVWFNGLKPYTISNLMVDLFISILGPFVFILLMVEIIIDFAPKYKGLPVWLERILNYNLKKEVKDD